MEHSEMIHWYVYVPKYFVPVNVMIIVLKPILIYLLEWYILVQVNFFVLFWSWHIEFIIKIL